MDYKDLLPEHSIEVPVANTGAQLHLFTDSGLRDFLEAYRALVLDEAIKTLRKA